MKIISRPMAVQILKEYRQYLTPQEFRTCKGQTENDPAGCIKGLKRLLNRKGIKHNII